MLKCIWEVPVFILVATLFACAATEPSHEGTRKPYLSVDVLGMTLTPDGLQIRVRITPRNVSEAIRLSQFGLRGLLKQFLELQDEKGHKVSIVPSPHMWLDPPAPEVDFVRVSEPYCSLTISFYPSTRIGYAGPDPHALEPLQPNAVLAYKLDSDALAAPDDLAGYVRFGIRVVGKGTVQYTEQ